MSFPLSDYHSYHQASVNYDYDQSAYDAEVERRDGQEEELGNNREQIRKLPEDDYREER